MKVLSEKQFRRLLVLGNGCALVVGGRRHWDPMIRRGLVSYRGVTADGLYSWVRITPAGFRVLADLADRYGMPDLGKATA